MTEIVQDLTVAIDRPEILRCLGYPPSRVPSRDFMLRLERSEAQAMQVLEPRGCYVVHDVLARAPGWLKLGDVSIAGQVAEFLGSVDRIAAFVVTVGDRIAALARELCESGAVLDGWICDALGSWAAEAASGALMARLQCRLAVGEGLTLRYSPGYCGMDIDQQEPLFQLVQPSSIGVSLVPSHFMHPAKSISGLVGIGPAVSAGRTSPCGHCAQRGCHMRRGAA